MFRGCASTGEQKGERLARDNTRTSFTRIIVRSVFLSTSEFPSVRAINLDTGVSISSSSIQFLPSFDPASLLRAIEPTSALKLAIGKWEIQTVIANGSAIGIGACFTGI